jgi:uncharacterized membrane protein
LWAYAGGFKNICVQGLLNNIRRELYQQIAVFTILFLCFVLVFVVWHNATLMMQSALTLLNFHLASMGKDCGYE